MSERDTWADGSPKVDAAPAAPELELGGPESGPATPPELAPAAVPATPVAAAAAAVEVELAHRFGAWIERNPMAAVELLDLYQEAAALSFAQLADISAYLGAQFERIKLAQHDAPAVAVTDAG